MRKGEPQARAHAQLDLLGRARRRGARAHVRRQPLHAPRVLDHLEQVPEAAQLHDDGQRHALRARVRV